MSVEVPTGFTRLHTARSDVRTKLDASTMLGRDANANRIYTQYDTAAEVIVFSFDPRLSSAVFVGYVGMLGLRFCVTKEAFQLAVWSDPGIHGLKT